MSSTTNQRLNAGRKSHWMIDASQQAASDVVWRECGLENTYERRGVSYNAKLSHRNHKRTIRVVGCGTRPRARSSERAAWTAGLPPICYQMLIRKTQIVTQNTRPRPHLAVSEVNSWPHTNIRSSGTHMQIIYKDIFAHFHVSFIPAERQLRAIVPVIS